ncbi:MAG: ABC transporter permease [Patescibacteria group bacterium]
MNWSIIKSLVIKDLKEIFRNKFSSFITILTLVSFFVIYLFMPQTVDETIEVAFYSANLPITQNAEEQGISLVNSNSADEVKNQVENGDYQLGIVLGDNFLEKVQQGDMPEITIYFSQTIPPELEEGLHSLIQELAYQITGTPLPVDLQTEVIGQDMVGNQIPQRERSRTMFIAMILLIELIAISSLILEEIDNGVLRAILVSPASLKDILLSKVITGFTLAFIETTIMTALLGALSGSVFIIILTVFLGSIMISGLAFLIGSLARDLTSSFGWSMLFFVILVIPTIAILMPGEAGTWVKILPSYFLVDALDQASNYAAGLDSLWLDLLVLFGFSALLMVAGYFGLKRRVSKI